MCTLRLSPNGVRVRTAVREQRFKKQVASRIKTMSESVIQSQQRDAGKFLSIPTKVDPLIPSPNWSISGPISLDRTIVQPIGQASLGQWVTFTVPYAYIKDMCLVSDLGSLTSGAYTDYVGLALVEEVQLRCGSNTLQQFNYTQVMHSQLARVSDETSGEILSLAGGVGKTSGKVLSPLPLFFSSLLPSEDRPSWNTALASTKCELRVRFRSLADVLDAGAVGGSPTFSSSLHVLSHVCGDQLRLAHMKDKDGFAYMFRDQQNIPMTGAVATGVSTQIDLSSLYGSVSSIEIYDNRVTRWTGNDYFICSGDVSSVKVSIDGKDYLLDQDSDGLVSRFDQLSFGYVGAKNIIGKPTTVSFAGIDAGAANYAGSLEMDSVNKLTLTVTHNHGSDQYFNVLGKVNALIVLEAGNFKRVN